MPLAHFLQELERSRAGDYHQVWRYTRKGKTPRLLHWLVENPNLLDALQDDAQALQNQRNTEEIPQYDKGVTV